MNIGDLFHKQIDRNIEGVIKIGQDSAEVVKHELEEYVVTRELLKHLDGFSSTYAKSLTTPTENMGVWISGFFGSGKSHLLKIISYLLDNKEVESKKPYQYFDDKIDDDMVKGDIARIAKVTKDVILFNIDSKADIDARNNKDAIVTILNKVFDDYLGFYGNNPWLSNFEYQLHQEGNYDEFKQYYFDNFDVAWEDDRKKVRLRKKRFAEALNATTDFNADDPSELLKTLQDDFSLSPESFALKVNNYILSKGSDHQVVFLIDEVGQYIGSNSNLMLNLQTVTEDLGKVCKGKSWIIVTSQQNIDSVVKVKGSDFSKIQGRFKTRLNLSSANVDEVIKKRILRKNPTAFETLKLRYLDNQSIIKNLLTFSSRTPDMKKYSTAEDYAEVYPFVPYQFFLLQEVFNSIRTQGASGKHLSQGERSLLSAFQESAVRNMNSELSFIMPFHSFFHTIESFLDHDINIVIQHAIDNDQLNDFDVNVLKLLFLIKYLGDKMPPNLDNITTLMVDDVFTDKLELTKEVKDSLDKLYRQALIQKNGDSFVFLTNAEQDINSEIKNVPVDYSEVIKSISSVIYDNILNADNKYKYSSEHIFTYNHKFDNDFYSSQKGELTLQVVSPAFNDGEEDDSMLRILSTQESSVIFKLPEVVNYFEEMEEAMKIETYLRRNSVKSNIPEVERIKITKAEEINMRKERVGDFLVSALSKATIYAHGQKLEIKEKSPVTRIDEAFRILVDNKYNKMSILKPFVPSSGTKVKFAEVLRETIQMTLVDTMSNKTAYDEILSHIENMDKLHVPLTVKAITDKYAKEPYHWRSVDVKGLLLRMFNYQSISLVYASETLDRKEVEKIVDLITKDSNLESIKIKKKVKPSKDLIKKVKSIINEAFNPGYLPSDEATLKDHLEDMLKQELRKRKINGDELNIDAYLRQYNDRDEFVYPGKQILVDGKEAIEKILNNREEMNFFNAIKDAEDDLFDYCEDVEDVKEFFKNKRKIFDEAVVQVNNFKLSETYVTDADAVDTINEIKDILKMTSPYREIHRLPELKSKFIEIFTELLEKESELVKNAVLSNKDSTIHYLEKTDISEEKKYKLNAEIDLKFKKLLDELSSAKVFRDAIFKKDESSTSKDYFITRIDNAIEKEKPPVVNDPTQSPIEPAAVKQVRKINLTSYTKAFKDIESDEDLDDVVNKFRELVKKEMNENTIIKFY